MEEAKDNSKLHLTGKQIRSISKVVQTILEPEPIREICLAQNYIRSIDPAIGIFTSLAILDLSINLISRIENLESLLSLVHLILSNNRIEEIAGLGTLQSLKVLDLSANLIGKIQELDLPELEVLRLYDNRIEVLEGLERLSNLQVLELNKNRLKDINHLSTLTLSNLRVLNISCNCITDLDDTALVVYSLKSLEMLDAYENPIESDFRYRFKLCENPRILELDGISITAAIRKNLEEMRRENSIDTLIKATNEEYEKRVENEKLRKNMVLRYMQQHVVEVNKKFESYRDTMNKYGFGSFRFRELSEFINYVNYVRRKREKGESVEVSEEFLKQWREKLQLYEIERKQEEERAKREIDEKYNSLILTKLISTSYSDKLYQISMTKPEVWKALKRKEYEGKMNEEKLFASEQINSKYRMLTQGLEKEQYLNNIINKGQDRVLQSIQEDVQPPISDSQRKLTLTPKLSETMRSGTLSAKGQGDTFRGTSQRPSLVGVVPLEPVREEPPSEPKVEEPPKAEVKSRGCVVF